jgi:photosystem II stability/assembly factor-like uncharacterized protein
MLLFLVLLTLAAPATDRRFQDPLDVAAERVVSPSTNPVMAMARAGNRLVGVGMRGLIIVSDDDGGQWRQVVSPVQSDLTAVHFPTATSGWAVGHDGVILHSADGGLSWIKQADGRTLAGELANYYRERIAKGDKAAQVYADQIDLNYKNGPVLPWLDVWFEDERRGFAVGSFGMIIATNDGGKTWQPWLDRVDNPDFLNLNAIRAIDGALYIAGEHGMVYVLNRTQDRFVVSSTGYKGSFFGIDGVQGALVAFGMRGTIYRSDNRGATWEAVASGSPATLTGAAVTKEQHLLLTSVAGRLLSSKDGGRSFQVVPVEFPMLYNGVVDLGDGKLVLYGLNGARVQKLN